MAEDLLQWVILDTRRYTQHLNGTWSFLSPDDNKGVPGNTFWWIKSSPNGNPWDIDLYDANFLYFWITENGEQAPSNSLAYKRFLAPVRLAPRFFTLGSSITIDTPGPNFVKRTINCEADNQPLITLGHIRGVTEGPFSTPWGGDVGTQPTIIINYYWGGVGGTYNTREREFLVKGYGRVAWDTAHWNGSEYVIDFATLHNTLEPGGTPTPNFACGYSASWWGSGGPPPPLPPPPLPPGSIALDDDEIGGSVTNTVNPLAPSVTGIGVLDFYVAVLAVGLGGGGPNTISAVDTPWTLDSPTNLAFGEGGAAAAHLFATGARQARFTQAGNGGYATSAAALSVPVGTTIANLTAYTNPSELGIDSFNIPSTTPGNTLVIVLAGDQGDPTLASLTDDAGDIFLQGNKQASQYGADTTDFWYCVGVGAATTISFHAAYNPRIWVYELGSGSPPPPPPPPPSRPPCAPVDAQSSLTSGVLIDDLSLFIGPATALYKTPILPGAISAFETLDEGRNAIVLDFNQGDGLYARDLGTVFSWPLNVVGNAKTILYTWQPALIPMPEGSYGRATDWMDGGTNGAKFIQGVMIEADSFANPKTFFLQDSDTLTLHDLNETPATFNRQSEKAFSCVPFVAHSARIISMDGVEWRVWSSKLVSQPWPEMCFNWQTEMTSLGLTGWGHVREMNLPYVSTAPVTLVLIFDAWPAITLTLPSTAGVQNKTKLTLPPNKFKLMSVRAYSSAGFRLFEKDLELKIKAWGTTEAYTIVRPFGGPSRAGAVV